MNDSQTKQNYEGLIESVSIEQTYGFAHWLAYRDWHKFAGKHWNVVEDIGVYFTLLCESHLYCALLSLCNIYDSNTKAASLHKIINCAERHPNIFRNADADSLPEKIAVYRDKISGKSPVVKNLFNWRHNRIAHFNKKFHLEPKLLSQLYPLAKEEIDSLYMIAVDVIGQFLICYNSRPYLNFEVDSLSDIDPLLRLMEKHYEGNDKQQ